MPTKQKVKFHEWLTTANRVVVVLDYFKLTKSWDNDDEEDLDVMITVNGQELYSAHNINHVTGSEYGQNKIVVLVGVSDVVVSGWVKCADYHEPFYGADSKTHKEAFPGDQLSIGAQQNLGAWEAKYRIVT